MKTIRLYDGQGRFVGRFAAKDLAREVVARSLLRGWAHSDGAPFWEPVTVTLARLEESAERSSGVRLREGAVAAATVRAREAS